MGTAMLLIMGDSLWHTAVVCSSGQSMASRVNLGTRDVLLASKTGSTKAGDASNSAVQREVHGNPRPSLTRVSQD